MAEPAPDRLERPGPPVHRPVARLPAAYAPPDASPYLPGSGLRALSAQRAAGNRAVAQLLARTAVVPAQRLATGQPTTTQTEVVTETATIAPTSTEVAGEPPASPYGALDDASFNADAIAHELLRAIDQEQHTIDMSAGLGRERDISKERRSVDAAAVITQLQGPTGDGLTPAQIAEVKRRYYDFYRRTSLEDDLFGGGQSDRQSNLTPDQRARIEVLLRGTKGDPTSASVITELKRYPPDLAARIRAGLEKHATDVSRMNKIEADAIELHELFATELDEPKRERVMILNRRPANEIPAMDAFYDAHYNKGTLAYDIHLRLEGLQLMRLIQLRFGHTLQADAVAIEDKRRQIDELNRQDAEQKELHDKLSFGPLGGIGGTGQVDAILAEQRRKRRQELTGDIAAIVDQNKREALADPENAGKASGEAIAARLTALFGQQDGEPGQTLGSQLETTLDPASARVITGAIDPWASGADVLVQTAAAQLMESEHNNTTNHQAIIATLRSFREYAKRDILAKVRDPRVPVAEKQAIASAGQAAVSNLAHTYVDAYVASYDRMAGPDGRTFAKIIESASDANAAYMENLRLGGGETSELGELQHAMDSKDLDKLKSVLRRQPSRQKLDELITSYDTDGHNLRRELFGRFDGQDIGPETAIKLDSTRFTGGMVAGRDAALVAELLKIPAAAAKGEARTAGEAAFGAGYDEVAWMVEGGATEYEATMDNRGTARRIGELTGDPETKRLMGASLEHLKDLQHQWETATDPAEKRHLFLEVRKARAALTGDADAYEKETEEIINQIRSAVSFAVSIALAVALPGAGAGLVAFLESTAINIAANVASNVMIKGDAYGWDDLRNDVIGGALGAGGAKLGEELLGRVALKIAGPLARETGAAAERIGVETVLSKEAARLTAEGEKVIISTAEVEAKAAGREAVRKAVVGGAREVGGFFGGIYGGKLATGDFSLTAEELLQALAGTLAGKAAHHQAAGAGEPHPTGQEPNAPARRDGGEEPTARREDEQPAREEETRRREEEQVRREDPDDLAFVPVPVPGVDPPAVRKTSEMLAERGIPIKSAEAFQEVADHFDAIIKVRPTNTASLPVLEAGGVPKPEAIKAKTINPYDQLLGAPADARGKVGFFDPVLPSKEIIDSLQPAEQQRLQDRFNQRREEFQGHQQEYAKLQEEGLIRVTDGVVQIADPRTPVSADAPKGEFKDIGGDHDLYELTDSKGKPLPEAGRRAVVEQLRSMGVNVEHYDHVNWKKDSPGTYDPTADAKIRAQHQTTEPLVAFVPKSTPREVYAGEPVTGQDRKPGPDDHYLPAAKATFYEPGPDAPGTGRPGEVDTPGETDFGDLNNQGPRRPPDGSGGNGGGGDGAGGGGGPRGGDDHDGGGPRHTDDDPFLRPTPKVNFHEGDGDTIPPGPTPEPRALNPDDFDAVPITEGTNQGKLRLTDRKTGRSYIFKPASGEQLGAYAGSGIATGERYRRAPAASIVGHELGLVAPETHVVRYGKEVGSLQEWVADGQTLLELHKNDPELYREVMNSQLKADIDAFDYLIANLDRNAENLIVVFKPGTREIERLVPIDMDRSFPPTNMRHLFPVEFWLKTAMPMPATISEEMAGALRHMSANREALRDTLTTFLGDAEIGGFMRRLDEIIAEMNHGTTTRVVP
jgi:hypothetical protein